MKKVLLPLLVFLFSFTVSMAQSKSHEASFYNKSLKSGISHIPAAKGAIESAGDTLYTFPIQVNGKTSQYNLGLTVYNGTVIVSSGGYSLFTSDDNLFYCYSLDGTFIDSIAQPNSSDGSGYRDMAFDGTNILASESRTIRKIDPITFTIVNSITNTNHRPHRGIAYDNGVIYTTNFQNGPLVKIDTATGATLRNYGIPEVAPYGIAADPFNNPSVTDLWYAEPSTLGTFRLSKVDTATGNVVFTFDLSSIFPNSSSGGLEIINNHPLYPDKIIAVMLVQANPDLVAFVDITTEGTPKPPTNVVAESPIHGYDVNLTWEDPTEDLAGNAILIDSIVIYRNEDRIASVNAGIQYFHDTEAYYSRVLTYSLVAWSDGNKSILASSNSIAPSSIFFDNFNSDLSKWEITNNGICPWELLPANFYQLPSTATGYCLAADADDCGSGTNINTIATMIDFIDLRPYGDHAYLYMEFDSDWEALDEDDYGYVEISSNGTDWEPILVYNSVDVRNEHVEIYITHSMGYVPKLKIRFRTVMPGWDWHWAIDNVIIDISYYPSSEPRNLVAIAHQHPYLHVVLTWDEYNRNQEGFEIYRRESGSEKKEDYNLIGFAELNATTFTDTSVLPLKEYEYRIRAKLLGGINYSYYSFPTTVITPIPVELTSFEAQAAKAGVFLKWSTATETNNSGFDVEKSINNSDFISIGFVEGMGTRTEITNYSFEDKSVSTGTVYYRLKQIDFDGSFEYSNTIEVDLNVILEYSLEQNYPNPFNPATKINYQIPEDGFVQLIIYDVLGNEVAVLVNEKKIPGIYEVDFDASNITSGVYLYSLRVNHFVQTNKMVILK